MSKATATRRSRNPPLSVPFRASNGSIGDRRLERLSGYSGLEDDGQGNLWQTFNFPKELQPATQGFGVLPCQRICGHNLKRFHFTCLFCRTRKALTGRIPTRLRVEPYMLLIWADRPNFRVKSALLKRFLTICELLAN